MGSAVTVSTGTNLALLEVTGGVHRGVAAPIDQPRLSIGAGGDADILLSDDGVADEHAVLRFERGAVFVEARGADVGLGRHVVPRGQGCKARLPVELSFGSSSIRIARQDDGKFDAIGWARAHAPIVGAVALCVMLFAATQADAIKAMSTGETGQQTSLAQDAAAKPDVDLATRSNAADPVAALRERVAQANIEGLRIETEGDRIVARGLLDDGARKRWAATQKWFDESFSGRYVLASEVGAKSAATMPRFQVQAIWFGATPYVVTADGQRRHPGATLADGWVIKDIRDGRLTVAKAGEEVSLNF